MVTNSTWPTVQLGELVSTEAPICYGILMPGDHFPGGVPVIKVRNFEGGFLQIRVLQQTSPEIDGKYVRSRTLPGDILLSIRGTTGGVAVIPAQLTGANITQDTARIRSNDRVDRDYLVQALRSEVVQSQIRHRTIGQAVRGINIACVRKLEIPLPGIQEQQAIAAVLSTWDRGIRQLSDLIAVKVRLKQGLMQQLLTGKRRLKGFTGGWSRVKASELFGNYSQKKNSGEELLSVTQDRGVLPRNMLDGKVVMPESGTDGYKLVEPGNFVISLRSFQGGLEYSEYRGLVSPAYTVLRAKQRIHDDFYRHYFKSFEFIQRLGVAVIGIRDGKQISYGDFEGVKLPQPDIAEQQRIAEVLNAADREICLLQRQLDTLKQQKKGLMQKLLTGQIRVPTGSFEP